MNDATEDKELNNLNIPPVEGEVTEEKTEEKTTEESQEDVDWLDVVNRNLFGDIKAINIEDPEVFNREDGIGSLTNYVKAVQDVTIQSVWANIQQDFPELYYVLAQASKGNDYLQELQNVANNAVYREITVDEENEELQIALVKQDLYNTLEDEEMVEAYLTKIKEKGQLLEKATKIAEKTNSMNKERYSRYFAEKEEEERRFEEIRTAGSVMINNAIIKGDIGNIKIPENEKKSFHEFLQNSVKFDKKSGKTLITYEVNSPDDLKHEFFRYRKGDLKDYIDRTAKTMALDKIFPKKTESGTTKETNKGQLTEEQIVNFLSGKGRI